MNKEQIEELIKDVVRETSLALAQVHFEKVAELHKAIEVEVLRRREYQDAIRSFKEFWHAKYPGETPNCPHIAGLFAVFDKYSKINTVTGG
jgi:hypothetical protein